VQLPDYTALGPKSQQQWRNLVFCRPGWVITMAALNRNYEFKKSVIIECRKSFFFFVVWIGRTTAPFPDDLLNQTEYNMAEK
jgi:hypothetical protein